MQVEKPAKIPFIATPLISADISEMIIDRFSRSPLENFLKKVSGRLSNLSITADCMCSVMPVLTRSVRIPWPRLKAMEPTVTPRRQRAISWLYQYELMKSTPKPKNYIVVRFEDFVLKQEETLERLECFLGIPLARIVVRPDSVGRWKTADGNYNFDFLAESLEENQYHQDSEGGINGS